MKKLNIILLSLFVALGFIACEDDRDSNPTFEEPTTFVLNTPAYADNVYDLKYSQTIELICSQPDYAYTTATTYIVQLSLVNDFTTEGAFETLTTKYANTRMNVNAAEFSKAMVTLWESVTEETYPTTPVEVYVRLKAELTSTGMGAIYSNSVKLSKVLANPEAPITLDNMYVTGTFCEWDWTKSFVMPPVNAQSGRFWGIMYFNSGDEFKLNVSAVDDDNVSGYDETLFSDATIEYAGISESNGNIAVGDAGWYLIEVKAELSGREMTLVSIEFKEPVVWLVGPISSGEWTPGSSDNDRFTIPTDRDGEFVSPAFLASDNLRMCVLLDDADWWRSEFVILNGKITYRGNGGDQERASVNAGQKAYLNFMDGTGSVK